jgi:hypothetical protein
VPKSFALVLALGPSVAAAFCPAAPLGSRSSRTAAPRLAAESDADADGKATTAAERSAQLAQEPLMQQEDTGSRRAGQNSFADVDKSIFAGRPALFDEVSIPGDFGFDPFNLASDKATLLSYRGAEVRHARLAMLAVAGWPLSELLQPKLAALAGAPAFLAKGGEAPSLLNGRLNEVSPVLWVSGLALAYFLETRSLDLEKAGKLPGDCGIDPLGLNSPQRADAEIMNGRVAMLAITGFAFQEAASNIFGKGVPVVSETPFFFHPPF